MFCGAFIAILETIAANKCFELKPLSLEEVRNRGKFFFLGSVGTWQKRYLLLVSDDLTHIIFWGELDRGS